MEVGGGAQSYYPIFHGLTYEAALERALAESKAVRDEEIWRGLRPRLPHGRSKVVILGRTLEEQPVGGPGYTGTWAVDAVQTPREHWVRRGRDPEGGYTGPYPEGRSENGNCKQPVEELLAKVAPEDGFNTGDVVDVMFISYGSVENGPVEYQLNVKGVHVTVKLHDRVADFTDLTAMRRATSTGQHNMVDIMMNDRTTLNTVPGAEPGQVIEVADKLLRPSTGVLLIQDIRNRDVEAESMSRSTSRDEAGRSEVIGGLDEIRWFGKEVGTDFLREHMLPIEPHFPLAH